MRSRPLLRPGLRCPVLPARRPRKSLTSPASFEIWSWTYTIAIGPNSTTCEAPARNGTPGISLDRDPETPRNFDDLARDHRFKGKIAVTDYSPKVDSSLAKGRCVRGTYIPSSRAEEITRSPSFTRPSRVLARFSVDGSDRNAANTNNLVVRGFCFRLGDVDQRSDIFTQSAPVHPARTQGRYLAAQPLPASFARTTYWGVHAFPATNAKGETRFIKFKVEPVGQELTLTADEDEANSANFLNDDLTLRIAARDVRFSVMALLDLPGDPVMDVSVRWPDEDEREAVRLGTIVITGVEANDACDEADFNPANLAEGIGHPPDKLFAARCAAYATSQTTGR